VSDCICETKPCGCRVWCREHSPYAPFPDRPEVSRIKRECIPCHNARTLLCGQPGFSIPAGSFEALTADAPKGGRR